MDLELRNNDLVFSGGDFVVAAVPRAMPLVLGVSTHAGSWAINPSIGVDLTGYKQTLDIYDLRMCLIGYSDCVVKSASVNNGTATIYVEVEGVQASVNI